MAPHPGRGADLRARPYEQPHDPRPARFVAGERVRCEHDTRPGRVVRALERDGLIEVDFGRHGITVVAAEDLQRAHP